jgi:hypothetical protein
MFIVANQLVAEILSTSEEEGVDMLSDGEARALALELGYRLEKYVGEDKYLIRDAFTDVRVAKGLTFEAVVGWLERERARRS